MKTRIINKNGISFSVEIPNDSVKNFWDVFENGTWEPSTFEIFSRYLNPNSTYFDIGAWIGPTVLYAAYFAKKVEAYEPDPVAFAQLKKNVELNPKLAEKITLHQEAFSNFSGTIRLYSASPGDSMSSVITKNLEHAFEVRAVDGAKILSSLDEPVSLVKIDIEGGEYSLLPSLKKILKKMRHGKPTMYISFHPLNVGTASPWFLKKLKQIWASNRILPTLGCYKHIYRFASKRGSPTTIHKSAIGKVIALGLPYPKLLKGSLVATDAALPGM